MSQLVRALRLRHFFLNLPLGILVILTHILLFFFFFLPPSTLHFSPLLRGLLSLERFERGREHPESRITFITRSIFIDRSMMMASSAATTTRITSSRSVWSVTEEGEKTIIADGGDDVDDDDGDLEKASLMRSIVGKIKYGSVVWKRCVCVCINFSRLLSAFVAWWCTIIFVFTPHATTEGKEEGKTGTARFVSYANDNVWCVFASTRREALRALKLCRIFRSTVQYYIFTCSCFTKKKRSAKARKRRHGSRRGRRRHSLAPKKTDENNSTLLSGFFK